MKFPFFRPKKFSPNFPIIPLFATEEDARNLLSQHATVTEEDPDNDKGIAQKLLVAQTDETRIAAGIWNGRVRFTNYLTDLFNKNDTLKGRKLAWFVDYYGGKEQFDELRDTGHMIFWENPLRKILIVFGVHLGPVRIIDQDPSHWPEVEKEP